MREEYSRMNLQDIEKLATRIIEMLRDRAFDVVTENYYHPQRNSLLEHFTLGSFVPEVSESLVKIYLKPRRCLTFDPKDKPIIRFMEDGSIRITRYLGPDGILIRTIVIKEKTLNAED